MTRNYRLKALVFSSIFPLVLTGCFSNEDIHPNSLEERSINTEDDSSKEFDYASYFDSIDVKYRNSQFYISDDAILDIVSSAKTKKECYYIFDGSISKLKEKIQNNSLQYVSNHSEYISMFLDYSSDSLLRKIQHACTSAFDTAFENLITNATNNLNEDICRIQTLSIVLGDTSQVEDKSQSRFEVGVIPAINDEAECLIILDYSSIIEACQNESYSDVVDAITLTLEHELNHCRQDSCSCRMNASQQYQSIDYNSPFVSFLTEASAESELYNLEKVGDLDDATTYDYSYISERESESLVWLLSLFQEDVSISDYYDAIFDADLEQFYHYFGLETEEDYLDFYHILYAIDSSYGRTSFLFDYYDKSSISGNESKEAIGYAYRNDIFNKVLADMVEYTVSHNDFSWKENLALFYTVKLIVLNHAHESEKLEDGSYRYIFDSDFSQSFWNSNLKYMEFLSNHYELDMDVLVEEEQGIYDNIVSYVDYYCDGYDVSLYDEVSQSLLDKFPLFQPILFSSTISDSVYDSFVKENNFSYQKVK